MSCKVWYEGTYPFPNFNGTAVEIWEWIGDFILHFIIGVITYLCRVLKLIHVSKRGPGFMHMDLFNISWFGTGIDIPHVCSTGFAPARFHQKRWCYSYKTRHNKIIYISRDILPNSIAWRSVLFSTYFPLTYLLFIYGCYIQHMIPLIVLSYTTFANGLCDNSRYA